MLIACAWCPTKLNWMTASYSLLESVMEEVLICPQDPESIKLVPAYHKDAPILNYFKEELHIKALI